MLWKKKNKVVVAADNIDASRPSCSKVRHLKVDFSDAEYSFLKAAALTSGKSIGAYVRDCVLAELKTKKMQDRVRDFFDADIF